MDLVYVTRVMITSTVQLIYRNALIIVIIMENVLMVSVYVILDGMETIAVIKPALMTVQDMVSVSMDNVNVLSHILVKTATIFYVKIFVLVMENAHKRDANVSQVGLEQIVLPKYVLKIVDLMENV